MLHSIRNVISIPWRSFGHRGAVIAISSLAFSAGTYGAGADQASPARLIDPSGRSYRPATPPKMPTAPLTPLDAPPGTWTLAVLPDTQLYAARFPEIFDRQTEWIAANRKEHDIRFVVHEGDITNYNLPVEWERAVSAFDVLKRAKVPFSLALGNHDIGQLSDKTLGKTRTTLANEYFKPSDYENNEEFGLFEEGKIENSWHVFTAPTGKYLVVSLEFAPRDFLLDWANAVVAKHPDKKVIVVTHAYTYADNRRYDLATHGKIQVASPKGYGVNQEEGGSNDGEEIWSKFVSRHPNIFLVLSGHVITSPTSGYLASEGAGKQLVHQVLTNYQTRKDGGGGYIRLIQFLPDQKTVRLRAYSPWYDHWLAEYGQHFDIQLR